MKHGASRAKKNPTYLGLAFTLQFRLLLLRLPLALLPVSFLLFRLQTQTLQLPATRLLGLRRGRRHRAVPSSRPGRRRGGTPSRRRHGGAERRQGYRLGPVRGPAAGIPRTHHDHARRHRGRLLLHAFPRRRLGQPSPRPDGFAGRADEGMLALAGGVSIFAALRLPLIVGDVGDVVEALRERTRRSRETIRRARAGDIGDGKLLVEIGQRTHQRVLRENCAKLISE